jgi:hypothetical protein
MNMFSFSSRTSHLLQHAEPAQEGAAAAAEVLQGAGLGHCRQSEDHCLPSGIPPYSFLHFNISQLIFTFIAGSQRIIAYLQASLHILFSLPN